MNRIKIYSTAGCLLCEKTKTLLKKWQIGYDEVRIDQDREGLMEMSKISNGARSVPQITIDGKWIGGFTELTEMHMDDELDDLMS